MSSGASIQGEKSREERAIDAAIQHIRIQDEKLNAKANKKLNAKKGTVVEHSSSTKVKKLKLKKKVDAAAGRKRPPEVQFDVDERSSKREKRSVTFRTSPSSKVRRLQRGRIPTTVLHMFTLNRHFCSA